MLFIFGWIILSVIVGFVATSKNRSFFGCFFLSMLISPLLTLIILIVMPAIELAEPQKVGIKVGTYTRKVFDEEFEAEWKTLSKYDENLQTIINKVIENVADKERRARVFDEIKTLYKIKRNVKDVELALDKVIEGV